MRVGIEKIFHLLVFVGALLFSFPCSAQNTGLEQIGDLGTIDWVEQNVTATGIGVPSENIPNRAQANLMAKRAAVVVARRNLLEVIKGLRINSTTTVKDFAVTDDTIVSSVKGVLIHSKVDKYKTLPDGTVEATVSMPFTGQLGEILTRAVALVPTNYDRQPPLSNMETRLQELEDRLNALENKLSGLKKINIQQEQKILLLKQFIKIWSDYAANTARVTRVDYKAADLSLLDKKINRQESRLTDLSKQMEALLGRLTRLEAGGGFVKPEKIGPLKEDVLYTGLVLDARNTGFRPCLKPEIFGKGEVVYPGQYVSMNKAVRSGYVRYYRQVERAQQGERAGALPYIITAKGTGRGQGTLEIGSVEFNTLKKIIEKDDNFMADCNVVIVF